VLRTNLSFTRHLIGAVHAKPSPFFAHDEDPSATEQKYSKTAVPFAPAPSAFTHLPMLCMPSCVCTDHAKANAPLSISIKLCYAKWMMMVRLDRYPPTSTAGPLPCKYVMQCQGSLVLWFTLNMNDDGLMVAVRFLPS
jgi:hypothetical protein